MLEAISTYYQSLDAVGRTTLITTPMLLAAVAVLLVLERRMPYRKGLPFFREGLWVDLIWYTLFQSFLLKILIFDFIIQPLDARFGWLHNSFLSDWSVGAQVAFFVITHDFYINLKFVMERCIPAQQQAALAHPRGAPLGQAGGLAGRLPLPCGRDFDKPDH